MSTNKTESVHCNSCHHQTKHAIVGSHERRDSTEDEDDETLGGVWWIDRYEMLECCGCETVKFRKTFVFSETDEPTVTYFPPDVSRIAPHWTTELPEEMQVLLTEIYNALHADSRRLAAMGARTLLDLIILNKVGDHGSFPKGIELLQTNGYLSAINRSHVTAALESGHAATHRGHVPTAEELNDLMDIIENLLSAVYVLDRAAENLTKHTPRRPSKHSSKGGPTA